MSEIFDEKPILARFSKKPTTNINTLSIDIGLKNLGYSVFTTGTSESVEDGSSTGTLFFGIFSIEEAIANEKSLKKTNSVVVQRSYVLAKFLRELIEKYSIERVIVERQVQTNVAAMELMYSIISISLTMVDLKNLVIYDPKKKFSEMSLRYDTKNKKHKKLSVQTARVILNKYFQELVPSFEEHPKKDDLADSILMNLLA